MSRKRKLESLAQLGVITDSEVKAIQSKLHYRAEAVRIGWHNVRWTGLAVVAAMGFGTIASTIVLAWRLSH